jgi:hypothetical protein
LILFQIATDTKMVSLYEFVDRMEEFIGEVEVKVRGDRAWREVDNIWKRGGEREFRSLSGRVFHILDLIDWGRDNSSLDEDLCLFTTIVVKEFKKGNRK